MSMPAVRPVQLPVKWVLQVSSQGVKRLECSADQSPLPSAEVKNVWSHAYAHPCLRDTLLDRLDRKKNCFNIIDCKRGIRFSGTAWCVSF